MLVSKRDYVIIWARSGVNNLNYLRNFQQRDCATIWARSGVNSLSYLSNFQQSVSL